MHSIAPFAICKTSKRHTSHNMLELLPDRALAPPSYPHCTPAQKHVRNSHAPSPCTLFLSTLNMCHTIPLVFLCAQFAILTLGQSRQELDLSFLLVSSLPALFFSFIKSNNLSYSSTFLCSSPNILPHSHRFKPKKSLPTMSHQQPSPRDRSVHRQIQHSGSSSVSIQHHYSSYHVSRRNNNHCF